ncbi:MAG: tetratricopeptide repeat protein [Planctomycetes bacterium]|nr:tetratricopeptide repeat protein [Planctomycetota bacterium]
MTDPRSARAFDTNRGTQVPSTQVSDRVEVGETLLVHAAPAGGAARARPWQEARAARYELREELGRGGMGEVVLAYDPDLRRGVAMKRLAERELASADSASRFVEEAQITAQLDHPNIVPVYELAAGADGHLYFTMKRVRGRTLETVIREENRPLPELLRVFVKVCDAVAFAASRGVVHRDLKPANVMVGEFGEVLVMDWGLAKVSGQWSVVSGQEKGKEEEATGGAVTTDRAEKRLDQTASQALMGTPAYMAPEQASGGEVDERTDVYALGGILYEILAGTPPHWHPDARGMMEILPEILGRPVQPPRERAPERTVPRDLEAAALKALERDPAQRYASAKELGAEIEAYLDGRMLQAARYGPLAAAWMWAKRHKAATAAAAAVLFASALLWGWFERQARREVRDRADEAWAAWSSVEPATRGEADPEGARVAEEKRLALSLAALETANAWRAKEPGSTRAAERCFEAADALGTVALERGEWTLAAHAFGQMADLGVDDKVAGDRIASVSRKRDLQKLQRRDEILYAISDIRKGLGRSDRERDWLLDDYVLEVLAFQDRQTADILDAEVAGWLASRPQDPALGSGERDLVTFACRVLGRLGLPEALPVLARIAGNLRDPELLIECATALCQTRLPEAVESLEAIQFRLGRTSGDWERVQPVILRVPIGVSGRDVLPVDRLVRRALFLSDQKRYAEAIADLDRVIELEPQNSTAHFNRANLLVRIGESDRALAGYAEAAAYEGLVVEFYLELASVRACEGRLAETIVRVAEALNALSRLLECNAARGNLLLARRDLAGAGKEVDLALAVWPDHPDSRETRAMLRMRRGEYAGALEDFSVALARRPRNARLLANRAAARVCLDDFAGAIADCDLALAIDPGLSMAHANRGEARRRLGDPAGAIEDLDRSVELDPRSATAFYCRGIAKLDLGDEAGALADCDAAVRAAPEDARAHANRGVVLAALGDHAGALAEYDRAIELVPGLVEAILNRGRERHALGDFDRAIADCDRVLALFPRHGVARLNRGDALLAKGDVAGALADYDRAVEIEPGNAHFRHIRGAARAEAGEMDGAIEDFTVGIDLLRLRDPGQGALADLYFSRAVAKQAKLDMAGALADLDLALERNPGYAPARRARGWALRALGRHREAARDFTLYLKLAPDDPNAAELREYAGRYGK